MGKTPANTCDRRKQAAAIFEQIDSLIELTGDAPELQNVRRMLKDAREEAREQALSGSEKPKP